MLNKQPSKLRVKRRLVTPEFVQGLVVKDSVEEEEHGLRRKEAGVCRVPGDDPVAPEVQKHAEPLEEGSQEVVEFQDERKEPATSAASRKGGGFDGVRNGA